MNVGWQCPACGRGNAPWLASCPCHQEYGHSVPHYSLWVTCQKCGTCYDQNRGCPVCAGNWTISSGITLDSNVPQPQ